MGHSSERFYTSGNLVCGRGPEIAHTLACEPDETKQVRSLPAPQGQRTCTDTGTGRPRVIRRRLLLHTCMLHLRVCWGREGVTVVMPTLVHHAHKKGIKKPQSCMPGAGSLSRKLYKWEEDLELTSSQSL